MKIRIKKSDGQKLCKLLLCLLIVLVFTGCDLQDRPSGTTSQPTQPAKVYDGTIIALGDSLTAGLGVAEEEAYPAVLEEKLQPIRKRRSIAMNHGPRRSTMKKEVPAPATARTVIYWNTLRGENIPA